MKKPIDFSHIKAFIFDVDGVFTDNRLLVTENGELLRTMNARDGYAIKIALKRGYHVAIITGGSSQGVKLRLEALGIKDVYLTVKNKLAVFQDYLMKNDLKANESLYMGDDIMDIQCLNHSAVGACPSDSVAEVLSTADYISNYKGGDSCVREVIELVLKSQSNWVS